MWHFATSDDRITNDIGDRVLFCGPRPTVQRGGTIALGNGLAVLGPQRWMWYGCFERARRRGIGIGVTESLLNTPESDEKSVGFWSGVGDAMATVVRMVGGGAF